MGEITNSPLFWVGLIIVILGFAIIVASLTVMEDYRLKQTQIPWWLYAVGVGSFGLFMIGAIMIVMAIAGADISKNVHKRVRDLMVEADLVVSK